MSDLINLNPIIDRPVDMTHTHNTHVILHSSLIKTSSGHLTKFSQVSMPKTQHNHCMQHTHFFKTSHPSIRVLPWLHCRSEKGKPWLRTQLFRWTGYTSAKHPRSETRATAEVPDSKEFLVGAIWGNLVQDLRRGLQSPVWIAIWALRTITLPRSYHSKVQSPKKKKILPSICDTIQ
jgi:hypothetical protein